MFVSSSPLPTLMLKLKTKLNMAEFLQDVVSRKRENPKLHFFPIAFFQICSFPSFPPRIPVEIYYAWVESLISAMIK